MQSIDAASSIEAAYIAFSTWVRECLWVRKLVHDFKLDVPVMDIRCDNQGKIALSDYNKMNEATEHIATFYHLVRDYAERKLVSMSYIPSQNMIADGMLSCWDSWNRKQICACMDYRRDQFEDAGQCWKGVLRFYFFYSYNIYLAVRQLLDHDPGLFYPNIEHGMVLGIL